MIPAIDFPESNFTYSKPAEMTDEQCNPLQVWKGYDTAGFPVIVSKWQLNHEEMKMIQETGEIYLIVHGHGMPAVSIHVENVFK